MASKKKVRKNVADGIVVVTASFNNTMNTCPYTHLTLPTHLRVSLLAVAVL